MKLYIGVNGQVVFLGDVLVIDDAPELRQRIAVWLASRGYHPFFVDNAAQADVIQRSRDFSVVLYGHEFSFPKIAGHSEHRPVAKKPVRRR